MPYASIVVPAYNAAATLSDTLLSLTSQTYRDIEIVVVDDGSTDSTASVARSFAARDNRIRLVRQANRGLAGARNSGVAAASGEVVGFCDADDLWLPEKMDAHVLHLQCLPEVGLSYAGSAMIDDAGRRIGHAQRPRLRGVSAAHVFKRNPVGNGSAPVFRRAALDDLAWRPDGETQRDWIFDEAFRQSEDVECWLRLALGTDWTLEGVPGLLTEYRISTRGLSANVPAQLASWERMVAKLRSMDPAFFARHEPEARAYQLRYLARRAVTSGDGPLACRLVTRAFAESRRPLIEEPVRSLTTWAAAHATARFGDMPMRLAKSVLTAGRS
ncbi:MAG: glycosyltransferase family 2 protein [Rhodobacteraceae bacterium]|jgi:glycosyltransferase involved in cell wall biosynthesis|uniref:Glycosyl transferase family 2 n=1 Tax=Salipiger profundus TaxID=1229727 RepID=A0A1U7DAZ5_9RHOB|nr:MULTISPECIES: glycosyltransferase family A protein [Salipiger]APX25331.1 Glycosyl transferase family 2 [Salipiger profundus]MAB05322.1 glycosyltransferase family 2 protein [Paracoccaceae bacterium]GGA24665.1 glycosyl transferase [Salipiger profundus]SFD84792.1 Glycosyl transferase family 2 [Salipiger profundus]